MGKSDERRKDLVEKHWKRELQAWKFFRFELERRWDLLYPGFDDRDYIHRVEYVKPLKPMTGRLPPKFLKQYFNPKKRGDFQENAVGQADGLVFRARQRLRSRYNFSLTTVPSKGYSVVMDRPQMQSFHLYLTPDSLAAGMKIASALDYAVTLSTPTAGASLRTFHFLAMPRLLRFGKRSYKLYKWLDKCSTTSIISENVKIDLVVYPAFCVRFSGESRHVAPLVWRLAEQYASLVCFNLVIMPGEDIEHSKVFFFPRPFRPDLEGPKEYKDVNEGKGWSFGAFEMGGFFVQGDESVFKELTYNALCQFLNEVSIFSRCKELQRIKKLLRDLTRKKGISMIIDEHCEEVDQLLRD